MISNRSRGHRLFVAVALAAATVTGGVVAAVTIASHPPKTTQMPAPLGAATYVASLAPTPAPTVTTDASGMSNGQVLDSDPGALTGGMLVYPAAAGQQFVVVDPTAADLPASVATDLEQRAATAAALTDPGARATALEQLASQAKSTTGHILILVVPVSGHLDADSASGASGWAVWAKVDDANRQSTATDLETATATAHQWAAAAQGDNPVVVVAP